MNKGILFVMPMAAFNLTVVSDLEGDMEDAIDRINFMQEEIDGMLPMLIDTYEIDQLLVIGMNQEYLEGIGKQIAEILDNKDIEIIIMLPEEENAEVSD